MKIITIVGARPQFIKASAVSDAIQRINSQKSVTTKTVKEIIVHTGQHFNSEMSDVFFKELKLPEPHYNLGINSKSHGAMTGRMLEKIEKILINEKPDLIIVYGDTNSTLAGALAAVKLKIRIAHIEAGLRSFNKKMPEENNRVIVDHCSDYLFCTSKTAVANLKREGIFDQRSQTNESKQSKSIFLIGDVMYDVFLKYLVQAENKSTILVKNNLSYQNYVLATIHRAENTDNPKNLISIFNGLRKIAATGIKVVIPVHPRTKNKIKDYGIKTEGFDLLQPLGYLDLINLGKNARMILTDSGGIQKEAYWLAVPCLTLRNETEWTETTSARWNKLVGNDERKIFNSFINFNTPEKHPSLYGDGKAAKYVVDELLKIFN